jgi:hypothetical protein
VDLGIKARASCMLGKRSTTVLLPQSDISNFANECVCKIKGKINCTALDSHFP